MSHEKANDNNDKNAPKILKAPFTYDETVAYVTQFHSAFKARQLAQNGDGKLQPRSSRNSRKATVLVHYHGKSYYFLCVDDNDRVNLIEQSYVDIQEGDDTPVFIDKNDPEAVYAYQSLLCSGWIFVEMFPFNIL